MDVAHQCFGPDEKLIVQPPYLSRYLPTHLETTYRFCVSSLSVTAVGATSRDVDQKDYRAGATVKLDLTGDSKQEIAAKAEAWARGIYGPDAPLTVFFPTEVTDQPPASLNTTDPYYTPRVVMVRG
jgi:hypothetical protein